MRPRSPIAPDALLALIDHYLRALYDDPDFAAFHRLHSPAAPLILGARVLRAREVAPLAFAHGAQALLAAHRLDLPALRRRAPRFTRGALRAVLPGPALPGDETVALVALEVAFGADGASCTAAFAAAAEADGPRLRWVTLADASPAAPAAGGPRIDVERLQAQAHGELAYLPLPRDGAPLLLSALELSHYRQRRLPQTPIDFLPEAAFSCHGTGRCCDSDWVIHLSEADRAALEARDYRRRLPMLPADRPLFTRIPAAAQVTLDPRPFALARRDPRTDLGGDAAAPPGPGPARAGQAPSGPPAIDRRCLLLDDQRRCVAHAEAGMAVYHDCHVFPFGFTATPDGVAAWSLLSCPSARARRGLGFAQNQADIRGRLQRVPVAPPPAELLLRPGVRLSWPAFRAAEAVLLRYLDADAPPRQRLLAALRWLERWERAAADPAPAYDEALLRTPLHPPVPAERAVAAGVFTMMTQNPYLRPLGPPPAPPPQGGARFSDDNLTGADFVPYLLRTLVFSKTLSFRYGVVPGFNFTVLAYALLARRLEGWRLAEVSEDDLGAFFSSLQQSHYHRLLALLQEHALLRELSASPLFGELLLRAAVSPEGQAAAPDPAGRPPDATGA